jgi:hypothetical protein
MSCLIVPFGQIPFGIRDLDKNKDAKDAEESTSEGENGQTVGF